MGLYYATQTLLPLVGTKDASNTRTGVALTTAYQTEGSGKPTKTFDVGGYSRAEFAVSYTMGSGETSNSIEMILEWSPDGTSFYRLATDSTSAGTSTIAEREFTFVGTTDAGVSDVTWGLDIAYKDRLRVSFKETGVASNAGKAFCEVLLSGR